MNQQQPRAVQHAVSYLQSKGKHIKLNLPPFFDTTVDQMGTFHNKCDNKGMMLTVAYCSQGTFAGLCSAWDSRNAYVPDNNAVLFDDTGAHPPALNHANALYCNSGYGPTWGGGHTLYLGPVGTFAGAYAVAHASHPTWTAKGNPINVQKYVVYQVHDGLAAVMTPLPRFQAVQGAQPVVEQMLSSATVPYKNVNIGVFGFAQNGKTSLVNGLCSAFSGQVQAPVTPGTGAVAGGQHTVRPTKIKLVQWFHGHVPPTRDHEVCLWDLVGHRSLEETLAYIRGQVHDGEEYPRTNANGELGKVLSRPVSVPEMITCMIVAVSAKAIASPQGETVQKLKELLAEVNNLSMPGGKRPLSVPVLLVITKVDETEFGAAGGKECLLYGSDGPLKELYDFAKDPAGLGIAATNIVCTGWLDSDRIAYAPDASGALDPCTATLRLILLEACKRAVGPLRTYGVQP